MLFWYGKHLKKVLMKWPDFFKNLGITIDLWFPVHFLSSVLPMWNYDSWTVCCHQHFLLLYHSLTRPHSNILDHSFTRPHSNILDHSFTRPHSNILDHSFTRPHSNMLTFKHTLPFPSKQLILRPNFKKFISTCSTLELLYLSWHIIPKIPLQCLKYLEFISVNKIALYPYWLIDTVKPV